MEQCPLTVMTTSPTLMRDSCGLRFRGLKGWPLSLKPCIIDAGPNNSRQQIMSSRCLPFIECQIELIGGRLALLMMQQSERGMSLVGLPGEFRCRKECSRGIDQTRLRHHPSFRNATSR